MEMGSNIVFRLIILISVTINCTDKQDLGGGYYFLPEHEAVDIGYPGGAIIYKSHEKFYFQDIIVQKTVIAAKSNNEYITTIRRLDNLSIKKDSLQYFIINKKSDNTIGPLDREGFTKKKNELNISINLIEKNPW